jgi:hypothetical protein
MILRGRRFKFECKFYLTLPGLLFIAKRRMEGSRHHLILYLFPSIRGMVLKLATEQDAVCR